jgi:type IV pilus assembly protein PilB
VRKICPHCKQEYTPDPIKLASLGIEASSGTKYYQSRGCASCSGSGFKGRLAIHEVLIMTRHHREMIHSGKSVDEIRDYSIKNGMTTLKQECIRLLQEGITTVEEAISVAFSQE